MNIDDLRRGYSLEDEFTARDLIILNLLISKGILTQEEINEAYEKLPELVMQVKEIREKAIEDKINNLKKKIEEGDLNDSSK